MLKEGISLIKLVRVPFCYLLQWANNALDPDVGVEDDIAQFYFMQLISAVVLSNDDGIADAFFFY